MENKALVVRRPSHSPVVVPPQEWGPLSRGYGYPQASDMPEEGIRYFAVLRRHRRALIAILLFCMAASLAITVVWPPMYRSKILLEAMGVNQDFMNRKDVDPNTTLSVADNYVETQTKLLASDTVADRVVAALAPKAAGYEYQESGGLSQIRHLLGLKPAGHGEPPELLIRQALRGMKIKAEGQSSLISATVLAPTPQMASDIANELAEQYTNATQQARWDSSNRTTEFLTHQIEAQRAKLQSSEDELQNYARQTGLIYTGDASRQSVAEEKLREIQQELEKAQADRTDKQSQMELAESSPADALPRVLDDGSLREDKSRLTDLKRQLADLKTNYTPNHYKVKQIQAQIDELESQSATERSSVLKRIQNDYRAASRREDLLNRQYRDQLALVSDQSAKEIRYNILKREVDANRDLYQSMLTRVKEAGVAAALRSSNIRVVDPAKPIRRPYQPSLVLNTAIGILAGCMLGLLYILIRERSDQSIRTPGESARLLDIPELAIIPAAKRDIRTQIPAAAAAKGLIRGSHAGQMARASEAMQNVLENWAQTESLVAESFRSAVTSILLWGRDTVAHQIIVVTSVHAKAGKTTSVFNLGVGLAEIGRRVLLIDGDMRRPRLGHIFGFERAEGLSDILSEGYGSSVARDLIRETVMPGLYVMPSGSLRANVPHLLHSPQFDKLLEQLRSDFDFVLIDSPPSVPLTDARLLAQHADGVILICRAGETSVEQLASVRKCFAHDGTHVIGTILNGWNVHAEDPSYLQSYVSYYGAASTK